jgi:cation transport ATPase
MSSLLPSYKVELSIPTLTSKSDLGRIRRVIREAVVGQWPGHSSDHASTTPVTPGAPAAALQQPPRTPMPPPSVQLSLVTKTAHVSWNSSGSEKSQAYPATVQRLLRAMNGIGFPVQAMKHDPKVNGGAVERMMETIPSPMSETASPVAITTPQPQRSHGNRRQSSPKSTPLTAATLTPHASTAVATSARVESPLKQSKTPRSSKNRALPRSRASTQTPAAFTKDHSTPTQHPLQFRLDVEVDGMTCSVCSQAILSALEQNLDPTTRQSLVKPPAISLTTDTLTVVYQGQQSLTQEITQCIQDIGYSVANVTLTPLGNHEKNPAADQSFMDATSSPILVAGQLFAATPRVLDVGGNDDQLPTGDDETCSTSSVPLPRWVQCIATCASFGVYRSRPGRPAVASDDDDQDPLMQRWTRIRQRQDRKVAERRNALVASGVGTIPIWILTMVLPNLATTRPWSDYLMHHAITWHVFHHSGHASYQAVILLVLATMVQFGAGFEFYRGAYYSIKSRHWNMDVLVALGTSASYLYAILGVVRGEAHGAHFFESAVTLISFILLGKWMQALAIRRTNNALTLLMKLQSPTAILVTPLESTTEHAAESSKTARVPGSVTTDATVDEGTEWLSSASSAAHEGVDDHRLVRAGNEPVFSPYLKEDLDENDDPGFSLGRNLPGVKNDRWLNLRRFEEKLVPIRQVKTGDIVKVVLGASVPADGVIISGEMTVDESMVTGESLPVLKTTGCTVLGGTICVESSSDPYVKDTLALGDQPGESIGAAFIRVTGVGSSTALAQIIQLVQDAQSRTVPIQSLADRISGYFVPAVTVISILTSLVWYALCRASVVPAHWYTDRGEDSLSFSFLFGLACLVISCPCALGLATPTAIMVATAVGARLG